MPTGCGEALLCEGSAGGATEGLCLPGPESCPTVGNTCPSHLQGPNLETLPRITRPSSTLSTCKEGSSLGGGPRLSIRALPTCPGLQIESLWLAACSDIENNHLQ